MSSFNATKGDRMASSQKQKNYGAKFSNHWQQQFPADLAPKLYALKKRLRAIQIGLQSGASR
jgi:hypothetical protein